MKTQQAIILFSILLVGIILCSFFNICRTNYDSPEPLVEGLISGDFNGKNRPNNNFAYTGTKYDNYNHYSGSSVPTLYYGKNGEVAKVIESNNFYSILVTMKDGKKETYTVDVNKYSLGRSKMYDKNGKLIIYDGPNKATAKLVKTVSGDYNITITKSGKDLVLTAKKDITHDVDHINRGKEVFQTEKKSPNYFPPGFFPSSTLGRQVRQPFTGGNGAYMNSLPQGIPRSQIPPGQEDLYILKSEVVPPVCPACPTVCTKSSEEKKCPPCPPCARCPEPSFECKKVPNYNAANNDYLPVPVLNDFSTFGM